MKTVRASNVLLGLTWLQTLDTLIVFLKEFFFEKVDFEKKSADKKAGKNFPGGKELTSMSDVSLEKSQQKTTKE